MKENKFRASKTMRIDMLAGTKPAAASTPAARPAVPRARPKRAAPAGDPEFMALFENMYDGAVLTDMAGAIAGVNHRACELLGYPEGGAAGMSISEIIVGADAALIEKLAEPREQSRFTLIHAYCKRSDGSYFPSEIAVSRFAISDRPHICFMLRDISMRLSAEQALREERNMLRILIDNVPDFIYVKDGESKFVICNRAVAEFMGAAAPENIVGKTDSDFYPPELAAKYGADERRIMATGKPLINVEEPGLDREKRRRILLTTKMPLLDTQGDITGLVGIGRDITDQRILDTQRLHAQKMESIGQLAAGIAHEINTPIQYVGDNLRFLQDAFAGMSTLLKQCFAFLDSTGPGASAPAIAEARQKFDFDYIEKELPLALHQSLEGVNRVAKIVHAMREFSHPDADEKAPADINRAIESTVTVSRNEWKYVADIKTDFDPAIPPVPCYIGHFNQVMLNLIVNAAHAIADKLKAEKGEHTETKGLITISTRGKDNCVEIRVSDTGTGIPKGIRHRIFEPFFTTKEIGRGTGQGLSTCHAVISRKHGGDITFETEEGKGTTFIVRLPIAGSL